MEAPAIGSSHKTSETALDTERPQPKSTKPVVLGLGSLQQRVCESLRECNTDRVADLHTFTVRSIDFIGPRTSSIAGGNWVTVRRLTLQSDIKRPHHTALCLPASSVGICEGLKPHTCS